MAPRRGSKECSWRPTRRRRSRSWMPVLALRLPGCCWKRADGECAATFGSEWLPFRSAAFFSPSSTDRLRDAAVSASSVAVVGERTSRRHSGVGREEAGRSKTLRGTCTRPGGPRGRGRGA
eukprot:2448111-Rhodomonas_salina.1